MRVSGRPTYARSASTLRRAHSGRMLCHATGGTPWDAALFVHRAAIKVASGDRQMGQRLASSCRPCDGPSVSQPSTHAGHGTCRNQVRFAASSSRSHLATTGSGRPTVLMCEGERRPLAVENVDPSLVDVCPLRGRRSPLAANSQLDNGPARLHGAGRSPRNASPSCGL